jgi:hypothetical protein
MREKLFSVFSIYTLCILSSHFAEVMEQREMASNWHGKQGFELFLYWLVVYPNGRTMEKEFGIARSVQERIWKTFLFHSISLSSLWINPG